MGTARPDWVGIIGTGQSLGVGVNSGAPVSTTQPFQNLKLTDTGTSPLTVGPGGWAVTPLVEPIRPPSVPANSEGAYPGNINGETPHSGMANTLSQLWLARGNTSSYVTAHSVVGQGGQPLDVIEKGGSGVSYAASIHETSIFASLAQAAGKTYAVGGIVLTHGEQDAVNLTPSYGDGLFALFQDYNQDVKAITGQVSPIVLLGSQQSTISAGSNSSAVQLWQAGAAHPGQIVCTGPKYQYEYGSDGLHMPAAGYVRLGQKYAEVFDQVVNQQVAWAPLEPTSASLAGAQITINFLVPHPPLNWATALPLAHQGPANTAWKNGKGFEVLDDQGNPLTIQTATIQGSSVVLALSTSPPAGQLVTVQYAITQDTAGWHGGIAAGMIGQLRDSDDFVGYDAETLSVQVTNGSPYVTSTTAGEFARRAGWDDVSGAGLPAGTVVLPGETGGAVTLSSAWTGATGTATLSFHHDESNYAVHFSMPVVPPSGIFALSANGYCLEYQGTPTNGTAVLADRCSGSNGSQQWTLESDGTIRPAGATSLCLNYNSWTTQDGVGISLYACNATRVGQTNQQWQLTPNGTIQLQQTASPGQALQCLDIPGATSGSVPAHAPVTTWSCDGGGDMQFQVVQPGTSAFSVSGYCLDYQGAPTNGTAVQADNCSRTDPTQRWIVETDGTIRPAGATSLCLNYNSWSNVNGESVGLYTCNATSVGQTNQQWMLTPTGAIQLLQPGQPQQCLDIPGASTGTVTAHEQVVTWTCNGGGDTLFQVK